MLTAHDVATGTPATMSPEQVLGRPVDARSDLYGVGCVAYRLLTGHLVFEGTNAMEVLIQHVHGDPVPPSRRTELPIPSDLERIVLSCLAKSPGDRPAGAEELAALLAGCASAGDWSGERARAWWDAHRPTGTA
jgi:serine/threonine-protein kinase